MVGNSFGTLFRITTFGESHGPALGVVVDGCPAGLSLNLEFIQSELDRRKPGQSKLVTPRKEADEFKVLSGVYEGTTTGAPLAFVIENTDVKSKDYDELKEVFRPGHADFTYFAKYGIRDHRGGGRASARETAARVLAGAVAKQILSAHGIALRGGVVQVGRVSAERRDWNEVENNEVRSVDAEAVPAMIAEINEARKARDSVGAVVEVQAEGVPPGLGEPVFGKLDAVLGAAMLSIPAVKGVEIGTGFAGAAMRGTEFNDEMFAGGFLSNNHGGILGGISSGAPIVVRLAVKPTSSIPQARKTINTRMEEAEVTATGRHDPCVGIRAVPVAEAMLALVLVDFLLQQLAAQKARETFSPLDAVSYGMAKRQG